MFNITANITTFTKFNIFIGAESGYNQTSGSNTGIGYRSIGNSTTGTENNAIGGYSLYNTTGDYNSAIGYNAGFINTSGSSNIYIGSGTDTVTASSTKSIAIGYNASITLNNQVVLGTSSEFIFLTGGLNYSIQVVTVSGTILALPVMPLIFCNNTGAATFYLPQPTQDGATTTIRLLTGAGAVTVSVTYTNGLIYAANNQTASATNSVPNNVSSKYVYQSPEWFQVTTF